MPREAIEGEPCVPASDAAAGTAWDPVEFEAAVLESATFLDVALGVAVPLRDYCRAVAILAEALELSDLRKAALSCGDIAD